MTEVVNLTLGENLGQVEVYGLHITGDERKDDKPSMGGQMLKGFLRAGKAQMEKLQRERRRVAVAAREVIDAFYKEVMSKFAELNPKVDRVLSFEKDALARRIDRLEVMMICTPDPYPTVE